ncbi:MAG: AzlC family ABC transporter permease [Ruminiclostridium sp.]|nr:AzlC family ABC transporter permease [Ruminiclostridium sp.]
MHKQWQIGLKASVPILLGYIPIGLAFGILAAQQGLSVMDILVMSLFVYAGSAQFIAAAMMSSGADAVSIVMTTFFVNLRHLLMSASLSPHLKKISTRLQAVFAFGITDETFAVSGNYLQSHEATPGYFSGLHFASHTCWILSTVLGGIFGAQLTQATKWGLDFALSGMFIGLLLMQMKKARDLLVAVCAGALSLLAALTLKGNWNVIIAAVVAATVGMVAERWNKKQSLSSLE